MTQRDLLIALVAAALTLGMTHGAGALVPVMGTSIFHGDETEVETRGGVHTRGFANTATATLLNLTLQGVRIEPGATPHPTRPHAQPEEQLVLVRRGSLRVELGEVQPTTAGGVEDTIQTLGAGDVLFLAPNQKHSLESVGSESAAYYAVEWRSPGMQGGKEPLTSQPY